MNKYERHAELQREQNKTKLVNCALLAAYIYGQPGGWYCVCSGHVDGFRSDYAVLHSNPGNLDCHKIRLVCLAGSELPDYQCELEAILNGQSERPLVATVTAEEKTATLAALREAAENEDVKDLASWLEALCASVSSDVSYCDWAAVAQQVKGEK